MFVPLFFGRTCVYVVGCRAEVSFHRVSSVTCADLPRSVLSQMTVCALCVYVNVSMPFGRRVSLYNGD